MVRILFVGDPHFGRNPSYLKPNAWRKYVADMLSASLEAAVRHTVDYLVVVGDIFDNNNPSPLDVAEVMSFILEAKSKSVKIIFFHGNHDYIDANTSALEPFVRLRKLVKVIKKPTDLVHDDVKIKFLPWSAPDGQEKVTVIKDEEPCLVVHHSVVKGSMMDNGWIADGALADGVIPRKKDFLVGGHLHTHQLIGNNILYVGTALPHHWNHEPQGFVLIDAEMREGRLVANHLKLAYNAPFELKEVKLKTFLAKHKKDKRKTYYRVIAKAGTKMPDDKRIVSCKYIAKPVKDQEDKTVSNMTENLPNPITWLIGNLSPDLQQDAKRIISSVKHSLE